LTALLVHVVLISFRPDVGEDERQAIREELSRLSELCGGRAAGILYWRSDWNLDQRKGLHLMEFALFENRAAFERFHAHPAHRAFSERLSKRADWVVGDLGADQADLVRAIAPSAFP
jgi:hypothetical protein